MVREAAHSDESSKESTMKACHIQEHFETSDVPEHGQGVRRAQDQLIRVKWRAMGPFI